jgi:[protein-PII] uridylyltransferase
MEILSAEINTLAEGLVLDRFYVQDMDFEGAPSQDRLDDISCRLVEVLKDSCYRPPRFPRLWGKSPSRPDEQVAQQPSLVRLDSNTSEKFTIVDVFATDRMGLLYTITRILFEFDLSVHMAKIGTHLDQVVDVFYVTDLSGAKIQDEGRLERLRNRVLQGITEFERASDD